MNSEADTFELKCEETVGSKCHYRVRCPLCGSHIAILKLTDWLNLKCICGYEWTLVLTSESVI